LLKPYFHHCARQNYYYFLGLLPPICAVSLHSTFLYSLPKFRLIHKTLTYNTYKIITTLLWQLLLSIPLHYTNLKLPPLNFLLYKMSIYKTSIFNFCARIFKIYLDIWVSFSCFFAFRLILEYCNVFLPGSIIIINASSENTV